MDRTRRMQAIGPEILVSTHPALWPEELRITRSIISSALLLTAHMSTTSAPLARIRREKNNNSPCIWRTISLRFRNS